MKRSWNSSASIMLRKYFKRMVSRYYKKKTALRRYVSHFSVDYEAISVDDILDIHKYLMKKNKMI